MNEYTDWLLDEMEVKNVRIVSPRSAIKHNVGVEVTLRFTDNESIKRILETIRAKEKIAFAIESIGKDTQRS